MRLGLRRSLDPSSPLPPPFVLHFLFLVNGLTTLFQQGLYLLCFHQTCRSIFCRFYRVGPCTLQMIRLHCPPAYTLSRARRQPRGLNSGLWVHIESICFGQESSTPDQKPFPWTAILALCSWLVHSFDSPGFLRSLKQPRSIAGRSLHLISSSISISTIVALGLQHTMRRSRIL